MSPVALLLLSTALVSIPGLGDETRPAWAVPGVPATVWRLVEASVDEDTPAARDLLRRAEDHARRTLVEAPDDIGRRYALAVVLGLRADREGGRTAVRIAADLYDELLVILNTDPGHAGARHILGRLQAAVQRMSGTTRWIATHVLGGGGVLRHASWAAAEENLAFAERHAPEVPDHHYELARLYLDTGRAGLAAEELRHLRDVRPTGPGDRKVVRKAQRMLSSLAAAGQDVPAWKAEDGEPQSDETTRDSSSGSSATDAGSDQSH